MHLAKEKLLDTLNENFISLQSLGEVETGSVGEQPAGNNPTDRNVRGDENTPAFPLAIPDMNDLKNPIINQ